MRCNEQIRLTPIRLIDEEGVQHGVVSTDDALRRARDVGLDLVEVSPNERPPVCKILDYGKYKYTQSKQKSKHHEQKLKEVRMRPSTDPHDRVVKMKHAREFFDHGARVQITMMFRGRERFHQDLGHSAFAEIVRELADVAKVERAPKMEGKRMTMLMVPIKLPAPAKKPQQKQPKPKPKKPYEGSKLPPPTDGQPAAEGTPPGTGQVASA